MSKISREALDDDTWKPEFELSERQREINDLPGSVLLLARSGTGKSVCVSDKMYSDRMRRRLGGNDGPLRQGNVLDITLLMVVTMELMMMMMLPPPPTTPSTLHFCL